MMGIGLILIAAISFLLVLSFLVFFHELGHYSVARFFGIAVDRFSIGFGRPIFRWKTKSGVDWMIARIPLGGYVKFAGDAGAASNPDTEKLAEIRAAYEADPYAPDIENIFHFRPVWQRALVILAGPIANFILAIVMFTGLGFAIGDAYYPSHIGSVTEGGAADRAGFQVGDKILTVDGKNAERFGVVQQYVRLRKDTEIIMVVDRDGREVSLNVTPDYEEIRDPIGGITGVGFIGLGLSQDTQLVRENLGPVKAIQFGFGQFANTITATGTYLGRVFTGKENGKQLGSVVKIATVTGKVATDTAKADVPIGTKLKAWAIRMIAIGASISIALGVANLMPLPVLDGGHLLYYSYEAIAGRPLSQKKQEFGFKIGFAVLLSLFVVLTINDIGYLRSIDFS